MKVILFGGSGMVGQGVLRECLIDPHVEKILALGRSSIRNDNPKLQSLALPDLRDYGPIEAQLSGYDACFFCLGISSVGMTEAEYRRITRDIAVAAANALVKLNPDMTFIFVSGTGADSSEKGKIMWARVKGEAENAILRLPFKGAYIFRPGIIQPLHGIQSRTRAYRLLYALTRPLLPVLKRILGAHMTTTENIGRAMLALVRQGQESRILENKDINAVVARISAKT